MQRLFALSLGFGAVLFLVDQAHGADCARRDRVIEVLVDRYGEGRQAAGLSSNGTVVEIFASDVSGTWTITATTADGLTCLVASGEGFHRLKEVPAAPGAPT